MYLLRRAATCALSAQPSRQLYTLRPITRVAGFQSSNPAFSRAFHQTKVWLAEEQAKNPEASPADAVTVDETVSEEPSKQDEAIKEESIASTKVVDAAQEISSSEPGHHHDTVLESSGTTPESLNKAETELHTAAEQALDGVKAAQSTIPDKASQVAESAKQGIPRQAQEFASNATEQAQSALSSAAQKAQNVVSGNRQGDHTFERSTERNPTGNEKSRILYVGNLFFEVTAPQLEAEMARFGEVTNSRIVTDNRGLSKGFGYIQFATQEAADEAVTRLNQKVFQGRRMSVQYHRNRETRAPRSSYDRPPMPPSNTLFVGNMSYQMSDRDLNGLFREIPNVANVRVAIDRRSGQPRGFAHAEFIDTESAQHAKPILEKMVVYGRQLRVDFSGDSSNRRRRTE